jgi:hypothetical protein
MLAKKSLIANTARNTGHGKPRILSRGSDIEAAALTGLRGFTEIKGDLAGSTWVPIIPCNRVLTRETGTSRLLTVQRR